MDHVSWSLGIIFKNHLLDVGLVQTPRDHGSPNAHNRWFILFYDVWGVRTRINRISLKYHLVEGLVTYGFTLHLRVLEGPWPQEMILKVSWDGLWTLSFGLSQCHGHGSCLCLPACQQRVFESRYLHQTPPSLVTSEKEEGCWCRALSGQAFFCPCVCVARSSRSHSHAFLRFFLF